MGINQFKAYALESMCEAHKWEFGQEDYFTLKGWTYRIRLEQWGWKGVFTLTQIYPGAPKGKQEGEPLYFENMGRLFHHIFQSRMISYN